MSLFTLAIAEEKSELLIDGSRNAAIKFKGSERADGASGTFSVNGDMAKGLITGLADLKLDAAKMGVGDLSGAIFYSLTDVMELVGKIDAQLPAEAGKELQKLNINIESLMTEAKSFANGNFNLEANAPGPVPAVKGDFTAKGDSKVFDGKSNFSVENEELAQNPVKAFEFSIAEKDEVTTFTIGASVEASSPYAGQMKEVGKNPDQIKQAATQQLGQMGIQVTEVKLDQYKEENGLGSIKLSLGLKEWRNVVKSGVGMMGGGQFDVEKMGKAVGMLLETKFESITFTYKMEGKALKGQLNAKVDNMRSFLLGYYQLIALVSEAQLKDASENADLGQRFMLAYQSVAMEEAQKSIQAMVDANMGFDMSGKFDLAGGAENKGVKASGDLKCDFTNFKGFVEKAGAAGLPTAKSAVFKMVVGLSDQSKLTGNIYGYSDAKVINYYKALMMSAAKKAGIPAEALALAEKVEFKSSAGQLSLTKDSVKGASYLEASDLTPVVKTVMDQASGKKLTGDLVGFSVSGKTEGDKMNIDGSVNFTKLLEGKSADEVKSIMGVREVKEGAKPEEVKLVAVTKPEVAMPAELKPIADDGKKMLSTNPLAAALGGGAGGAGGGNMLFILGGLAAVGVVGVGVAAGRGKK